MKIMLTEGQLNNLKKSIKKGKVHCKKCGWEWDLSDGGEDPYTCHKCGDKHAVIKEDDEIRLGSLTDKQVKSIDDLNKDAKFLKCKACKKLYTQTTHKKKKSLPICPWCGKHNE